MSNQEPTHSFSSTCSNKKPEQKSPCGEGKPVNPILGCKILIEEPDVAYEGMLGQGLL